MPAGRPPKPVEAHLLEGTYRQDRHGDVAGQIIPVGEPIKPNGLEGHASKLWDTLAPLLSAHGARFVDSATLAEMCVWYGRYRKAADAFDAMEPTDDGANRVLQQVRVSWENFYKLASDFGISPATRARLRIAPEQAVAAIAVRKRA